MARFTIAGRPQTTFCAAALGAVSVPLIFVAFAFHASDPHTANVFWRLQSTGLRSRGCDCSKLPLAARCPANSSAEPQVIDACAPPFWLSRSHQRFMHSAV